MNNLFATYNMVDKSIPKIIINANKLLEVLDLHNVNKEKLSKLNEIINEIDNKLITKGEYGMSVYASVDPVKSKIPSLLATPKTESPFYTVALLTLALTYDYPITTQTPSVSTQSTNSISSNKETLINSSNATSKISSLAVNSKWTISEGMLLNLLTIEGDLGFKAKKHPEFGEDFVTGPYGMVYKHIDTNGNLLDKPTKFLDGEIVTPEWAKANATAYYNKSAAEWQKVLKNKQGVTQSKLDALVAASCGTVASKKRLLSYVVKNWGDDNSIANMLKNFALTSGNGKVQPGLVTRRKFESGWFLGGTTSYKTYLALRHSSKSSKVAKAASGTILNASFTPYTSTSDVTPSVKIVTTPSYNPALDFFITPALSYITETIPTLLTTVLMTPSTSLITTSKKESTSTTQLTPNTLAKLDIKLMIDKYGDGVIHLESTKLRSKNSSYGVKNSWHKVAHSTWKNSDGSAMPMAYDLTPTKGHTFADVWKVLAKPEWLQWLAAQPNGKGGYGWGICDESTPTIRATHNWKATGDHIHMGAGTLGWNLYVAAMKRYNGINVAITPTKTSLA